MMEAARTPQRCPARPSEAPKCGGRGPATGLPPPPPHRGSSPCPGFPAHRDPAPGPSQPWDDGALSRPAPTFLESKARTAGEGPLPQACPSLPLLGARDSFVRKFLFLYRVFTHTNVESCLTPSFLSEAPGLTPHPCCRHRGHTKPHKSCSSNPRSGFFLLMEMQFT